jgi:hypothetical protein
LKIWEREAFCNDTNKPVTVILQVRMSWKPLFTLLTYHLRIKSLWYPLNRRMGEPQTRPWRIGEEKNLLPLRGNLENTSIFLTVVQSKKKTSLNIDVKNILGALWTLRTEYLYVKFILRKALYWYFYFDLKNCTFQCRKKWVFEKCYSVLRFTYKIHEFALTKHRFV